MSKKGTGKKLPVTKAYATALVAALRARSLALREVSHQLTKGVLREALLDELLRHFLPLQLGTGTGLVVNSAGDQSSQIDIVIYDKRVSPPLVRVERGQLFPWESVIATIEVKSQMQKRDILKANENAHEMMERVCTSKGLSMMSCVFGFFGRGPQELSDDSAGKSFLEQHGDRLSGICLLGQFSWMKMEKGGWTLRKGDSEQYEETKRFIAILIDNIRKFAERRWQVKGGVHHQDWMGDYIRVQE